jgi:hypothetical protein
MQYNIFFISNNFGERIIYLFLKILLNNIKAYSGVKILFRKSCPLSAIFQTNLAVVVIRRSRPGNFYHTTIDTCV